YRIYLYLRKLVPASSVTTLAKLSKEDKLLDRTTGSNWYSNTLSQGLHIHYIGPHRPSQPNMLRQSNERFAPVARAKTPLGFTNADWESPPTLVDDNIHAAYDIPDFPDIAQKRVIKYQSNGCNVISGSVSKGIYSGQIAKFRKILDLDQKGRTSKVIMGAR